jgi:hypothetical protein
LIEHVEETVCSALGIVSTRHRSAIRDLRLTAGQDLVDLIFRTVAENYERGNAATNRDRSQENWRWQRLQPQIAAHNTSPEVVLERAIAAACGRTGRTDWANQVPVASGLIAGAADRRRAIDLAHQCGERHFELIELKIASDTPLYAAVEIIGYGCIWLLARAYPPSLKSAILEAEHVDLRVLAPVDYYTRYDLTELEVALDRGCRALGQAQGVTMTFAFHALDERLAGSMTLDDDALLAALDIRISWRASRKELTEDPFLPGVPVAHVCARLAAAGGDEIGSGKFAHPESSAALAVNAFGWFIERPMDLPPLPGTGAMGTPERVEVEYCARLPWSGGRHPWLDAVVITPTHLIGVESKRFEPFRDTKTVSLSSAYDRLVWGGRMDRFAAMRDALRSGELPFRHLDAAQLVKHAFGLVTEARRLSRRPVLFYLYAEPKERGQRRIAAEDHRRHRDEIAAFIQVVDGDEVTFLSASYRRWIDAALPVADAEAHLARLQQRFEL